MEAVKDVKETRTVELGALLDDGDGAVVTLVAGDTRLVAHRAVLANRSPVFMAMFGHDSLEASIGQVVIPEVEGPVLRRLLAYLYTLQAPQHSSTAPQLLAAADKYGLLALKSHCEQQLVAQLSVENAAAAAVLAVRHSCSSLRQAALAFIKAHAHQVMATRGWVDAMREQTEDLIEMSRLLHDPPPETSAACVLPVACVCGQSLSSDCPPRPHKNTPSHPVPPSACRAPAATGDRTAASASTSAAASTSGSASAANAAPHQPHDRTPAATAPPSAPPDEATVSRLWKLSAEERNRRLREAARDGDVGELRALLAAGADVGAKERGNGMTALHWAALEGHVQAASCLLEAGARVGARSRWRKHTPLLLAADRGHAAVVRLLLASSADPNARDHRGRTPLHVAAMWGRAEAAAALLEAGADGGGQRSGGQDPPGPRQAKEQAAPDTDAVMRHTSVQLQRN